MKLTLLSAAALFAAITSVVSCGGPNSDEAANATDTGAMTATTDSIGVAADAGGEWISLFDGKTFNGWHGFNKKGQQIKNWMIDDSSLVCLGAAKDAHGGDIVSEESFGNFELKWDWKVTKGANSGVMYHVVEDPKYKAPYETGPEYQVIDDKDFPEKLEDWQMAGADYAMKPAGSNKKVNPSGQWNSSRIVYNNGHVEHWLNGEKIVEFDRSSDEWKKQRTSGKWKDYKDYGTADNGPIALQDHGNKVYFKNIMIKRL